MVKKGGLYMYYNLFAYPFIFPLWQEDILNDDLSFTVRRNNQIHFLQKIINGLIENNNNLPDYIQQEIGKMSSGIDGKVASLERFYDWAEQTYNEKNAQYQFLNNEWTQKWRWDPVFMQNGTIQQAIIDQKTEINNTATALNNKIHYTIGG